MSTSTVTIQAGARAVLVQYKEAGKLYNSAEGGNGPFDEVTVQAGETFSLPPGATLIAQRELGSAPQQDTGPDNGGINAGVPDNAPSEGGIKTPQGGTPD